MGNLSVPLCLIAQPAEPKSQQTQVKSLLLGINNNLRFTANIKYFFHSTESLTFIYKVLWNSRFFFKLDALNRFLVCSHIQILWILLQINWRIKQGKKFFFVSVQTTHLKATLDVLLLMFISMVHCRTTVLVKQKCHNLKGFKQSVQVSPLQT